jgi:tetratricopeptide (TPR) repeat protein
MGAHQAGRLNDAAALYAGVLDEQPEHVAALHLLGVVRHQQGDHAGAVALIGRAAGLRPDVPVIQASLAEACLALGEPGRAADCARAALRLGPDDPAVRWTLGQALGAAGRHEEAVLQFVQAVRLKPDFGQAFNSLGIALEALGRPEEAMAAYYKAVQVSPDLGAPLSNLGALFLEGGRHAEAHGLLERAVEVEPDRVTSWERLAELYERMERFDAAIPCRERVLALTVPERSGPHVALARALRREGRSAEAEAHVRAAVALEPHSAAARFHRGVLHEEHGDFAEAEACFRDSLRLDPGHDLARARLVTLLRESCSEADLGELTARLNDPGTGPESRVRLQFALAQALDARGEYARAAACLREAHSLSAGLARGELRFRPEDLDRFVDLAVAAFDREFFAKAAGAGLDTRLPVFVVGLPRSGTTLIEQVLASHPRVRACGELALARNTFESLPSLLGREEAPIACVSRLDAVAVRNVAGLYLNRLRELGCNGAERMVDKMPENYKHLGLLAALFPAATVVHCRRDPRDVALSCWQTDFLNVRWVHEPAHIAATFRAHQRLMDHWRAVLPVAIHEVDYEQTVGDLEGTARRLIAALGLDWDPACIEFHATRRAVRTGSLHQVRRPLYATSVGRWRRYEHALADLFAALPADNGADA